MNIPDFSIPDEECFLVNDKNGIQLKAGDILQSNVIPLSGTKKKLEEYAPVQEYQGKLIVPHGGSHLVRYFVESHCSVKKEGGDE